MKRNIFLSGLVITSVLSGALFTGLISNFVIPVEDSPPFGCFWHPKHCYKSGIIDITLLGHGYDKIEFDTRGFSKITFYIKPSVQEDNGMFHLEAVFDQSGYQTNFWIYMDSWSGSSANCHTFEVRSPQTDLIIENSESETTYLEVCYYLTA